MFLRIFFRVCDLQLNREEISKITMRIKKEGNEHENEHEHENEYENEHENEHKNEHKNEHNIDYKS